MIEVRHVTKRFGAVTAVDDLSFDAHPGRVTGFLGPNGSGKSTTMRCMLGLDRAERGRASFGGRDYRSIDDPLFEVGALLDAGYVHPGRTARNHLAWMALSNGIARTRVEETLELVGLTEAADRRVREFSLGMKQRLGLAGVLLGDPGTIVLDEPANGLDPEGIRWIRDVLTHLARQGRTVLVSSHLLAEIALMADDLVVIGRGRLIEQCTVGEFVDRHSTRWVRVDSPQLDALAAAVAAIGGAVAPVGETVADIRGVTAAEVGAVAARDGIVLHELTTRSESLEDAFLRATAVAQEFTSTSPVPPAPLPPPVPGAPDPTRIGGAP